MDISKAHDSVVMKSSQSFLMDLDRKILHLGKLLLRMRHAQVLFSWTLLPSSTLEVELHFRLREMLGLLLVFISLHNSKGHSSFFTWLIDHTKSDFYKRITQLHITASTVTFNYLEIWIRVFVYRITFLVFYNIVTICMNYSSFFIFIFN